MEILSVHTFLASVLVLESTKDEQNNKSAQLSTKGLFDNCFLFSFHFKKVKMNWLLNGT